MIANSIIDMDATAIAEKIKQGGLTSVDAVNAYIDQIKRVNPNINALVEERFTEALKEAQELDLISQSGKSIGALHGVPISVKESFHVTNMKTTGGLVHRQDLISREDADVITKLKASGAVILGKTNTPTLCFNQETENKLFGRTNNPWDVTKTAGGSSGGEGALLAVGGAAAGIASDIGGSIRIPAHFNGVVGFKPGMNQVSAKGHFPAVIDPIQQRLFAVGPMGKTVRDMRRIYSVISEKVIRKRYLQSFKVEILPGNMGYTLSETTKGILNEIEFLLEKSVSTKRTVPPFFDDSAQIWQDIISIGGSKLLEEEAYSNDRSNVFKAFFREKLSQKTTVHPNLSRAIIASRMFKPSAKRVREVKEILEQGDKRLADYMRNRILIFPIYHSSALKHGKVYKEIFSLRKTFLDVMPYVAYANVWGLPALSIPVGMDENNMPISIQLMSAIGNEDVLFRLGRILEKKFKGYTRCQNFDS
ncbi:amidase [Oceanobacillus arenosus]|uniref:Amidase n=1 Tax=Oceanobacillus arenosus TaxID=1229153 RepID=A0A3D8PT05_9BACI|nr:amidase [Oceanobacillus arenosus]RDW18707.1 amidase [Oceanobacillus arenosus]